jgi:hemerythrin
MPISLTGVFAMLMQWDDSYNLGIPTIDRQHFELYNMLNELYSAMQQGQGRPVAAAIMTHLSSHIRNHFAEEEKTLRHLNSPLYQQCCRKHAEDLAEIHQFLHDNNPSDPATVIDLLYLLDHLLDGHIAADRRAFESCTSDSIH